MHPDNLPSDEDNIWSDEDNIWSDEDILSSVDPALLAAIEDDGLSHSHGHSEAGIIIRKCKTATHILYYPQSESNPYNNIQLEPGNEAGITIDITQTNFILRMRISHLYTTTHALIGRAAKDLCRYTSHY